MPSNTQLHPIVLRGGLNLVNNGLESIDGQCQQLYNYEINTLGKYRRVDGFERFDGQPAPSSVLARELTGFPFDSDADEKAAVLAAMDLRRQAILAVPGSGPIRGVFEFKDLTYAFRDNVAGDKCVLYVSSATGWKVVTTPTISPGGSYRFRSANFGASKALNEIVGVDGVNPAFRFNGTTYTPITTDISPDAPILLEILSSKVLLLAFRGGTFLFSAVGDPTKFSPTDGGGEIGAGEEITGLEAQMGDTCAVLCNSRSYMLYGTNKDDFQFKLLSKNSGARTLSVQTLGETIFLDDRGLQILTRVRQFGDFATETFSQPIDPLMNRQSKNVISSFMIKQKNQYRICFEDGTGVIATISSQTPIGFSTFDFGMPVRCATSGENEVGQELVFFGSDDGFIYQVDRGNSFDGKPIAFACNTKFSNAGSPGHRKRWCKITTEIESIDDATVNIIPDFDYSDPNLPVHKGEQFTVIGGGANWDAAVWDESRWSTAKMFSADSYIDTTAVNVAVLITGSSSTDGAHAVSNMILQYSPRSRRR